MLKTFILASTILILPVVVMGQQGNIKGKQKKSAGTYTPSTQFIQISGANSSATQAKISLQKTLSGRNLPARNHINRKIGNFQKKNYIEITKASNHLAPFSDPEKRFFSFIERSKAGQASIKPHEKFRIKNIEIDQRGTTHVRSVQLHKGVEIYGSESTSHFDKDKDRFTGKIFSLPDEIETNPTFALSKAINKTKENLGGLTLIKELTPDEKKVLKYDEPNSKLTLYEISEGNYQLAWEIEIRPNFIEVWKYFIDAHNGEIIHKFNATNCDGPATAVAYDLNNKQRRFNTYFEGGQYLLADLSQQMYNPTKGEGIIITYDANNTSSYDLDYKTITSSNNTWNTPKAVSAHANTTATYEYLMKTFGRNSMNNQGGNIISFINVASDDGTSMANAFWNGQAAFYGNGGSEFKPLAGAQDVISHELGHGVVSNTANLEYYGQSGAINETYADIFGCMVDRDDWLIGEDIVKTTYFPSGALRNMADPHNGGHSNDYYWQPKHVSEMYIGNDDNGGVHINSGIGNHAFYLFATSVSKEKAEQVFYRALAHYLTKSSQFIDFRVAVVQSARDLYGENSAEVAAAGRAFDSVGIYEEVIQEKNQDYQTNTGEEFMLSYDTQLFGFDKLYRSTADGKDFIGITNSTLKGKPSVTDDGSYAVFVSDDDKIHALALDPTNPEESILSDEAFFDNVCISKDGNRLAAISTEIDASIYVYDFNSRQWAQFELYNPTTSHDNTFAGGVLYADAIEFDITGQYLIYDAYNELTSTTSDDINYWDIGFIKVWDNTRNTFAEGTISKLFTSLPENVSVGNPVFSKNSDNIIAFDYIDESTDEYYIIGANLLTGEWNSIFANQTLGFPSFSVHDDKIAFSALSTTDEEVIGVIDLGADKITAGGDAYGLVNEAKWPVYYATGVRTLGLPPVANFTVDYKQGSAPLQIQFMDISQHDPTSWRWNFPGGTPSTSTLQNPVVTYNEKGSYNVSLTATNSYGNNAISKNNYITVGTTNAENMKIVQPSVFPNPFSNMLTFNITNDAMVTISDVSGKIVFREKNPSNANLSGLPNGVYFVEMVMKNNVERMKIVKE
ncbi:MAG: T9SS type A sorting domain-containing protein [Bacteroidales bacterium]|nr:T9SS type A sorting domain-containing protein [Bacteroidales bacterium]